MVRITNILGYAKKVALPRKYLQRGFLDKLKIYVKGGTGGSGLSKYGGIGGRGGDVYIKAKENFSLRDLSKYIKNKNLVAGTGFDSSKKGILGEPGEDLIINVPAGVVAYHENGSKIGEVNEPEKKLAIALGGVGGCAETDYSPTKGEQHHVLLDLKLISDVALVGFPNAGKSTLLRNISGAKPKIAEYPFTTVKPNVAKIIYPDFREITIADLPGLIEGAHKNIGMGHQFLKHLERSKLLLFIVDIQGFRLSPHHERRNCLETVLLLNKEIELYNPELLNMPAMLIVNKMDTSGAEELYAGLNKKLTNLKNVQSEVSEDIYPEKVIEFQNIITTSLINKNKEEINNLREIIRQSLDSIKELEELKIAEEMPEYKLVQKLKRELTLNAPTLV